MASSAFSKATLAATLAAIATVLSGCYTYEVKMNYKCVSAPTAPNSMCMEWEQVGGVKTPTTCFPGEATVVTRSGAKSMKDLQIGDEILGLDAAGQRTFTQVRAWLHRDVDAEVAMSAVNTLEGTLVASPRHNVATGNYLSGKFFNLKYEFANELQQGSTVLRADGESIAVTGVSETTARGLYAPLTSTSNFFVGGPQLKTNVLAHSFAEVRHPQRYERIVQGLISIGEYFVPSINDVSKDHAYYHPVAKVLMKLFPWVMEPVRAADQTQLV